MEVKGDEWTFAYDEFEVFVTYPVRYIQKAFVHATPKIKRYIL